MRDVITTNTKPTGRWDASGRDMILIIRSDIVRIVVRMELLSSQDDGKSK